jgi:hypothetical protein
MIQPANIFRPSDSDSKISSWTKWLPGPTQALHIIHDPNREGQSDEEISHNLEETTDMVVLFINEASLANSPQVLIKCITVNSPPFSIPAVR